MHKASVAFLFWIISMTAWLLLTFKPDVQETTAGVIVVSAVVYGIFVSLPRLRINYAFPRGWTAAYRRIPLEVLQDSLITAAVLYRRIVRREDTSGEFICVPFDPGTGGRSATRNALVLAGISITPNTIAIDIDRDRKCIVTHQLVPPAHPRTEDRQWPI